MNSQIEKKYDKIITQIMKCELCKLKGKAKEEGSDHIFKAEPANIGKNYGKGKKILVIGHMPRKNKYKHSLNVYKSIKKYKIDSDNEELIEDWTISKGIKKYLKELLGHDEISYIAFTNIVKCQRDNKGKPTDKKPSSFMYPNCITFLKEEIKILDPDIIILSGAWFPKFYDILKLDNSGKVNTVKKIKLFNKNRVILNSYHPSYLTHWSMQKIGPKLIKKNAEKIRQLL